MRVRRAAWLVLVATACGYRFTAPGGPLPQGIRAVQAPVFNNVTPEPAAEVFFTESLREQLARAGTLGGDAADAVIQGTVVAVSSTPMAVNAGAPTYRLSAVVDLKLVRNGQVLAATVVSGDEDVLSGTADPAEPKGQRYDQQLIGTEANRQAALRRLADTLMREGYERLCTGW
ncbi:MAG: LptE family protein [Archangiaceae bacterium]|nr:LptE family protein [Archangiaceae bacterium]